MIQHGIVRKTQVTVIRHRSVLEGAQLPFSQLD